MDAYITPAYMNSDLIGHEYSRSDVVLGAVGGTDSDATPLVAE